MKLKELRLYGFKSFPQKTILALSHGMTALVGPNGCGKSNVLDAIRWVLGEQTLSRLRCGKNEDLVFAGSDRMPEQGYCEVSLTIENEGDFPELASEIEIKRRYYRTGESSFWINREECRLKEIEGILRGGAAGGRLYSVFDAAKLASIVSGELENLMESAAGVLGFREQRRESERKLELVRRDLVRLEDIMNERERIVRGLSRQRRRAEVYKELKSELVHLESLKMKARFISAKKEFEDKNNQVSLLEEAERKMLLSIEKLRAELRQRDSELEELLALERKTRTVLDDVSSKLSATKNGISSTSARREALRESMTRMAQEQSQALRRISEIESESSEALGKKEEVKQKKQEAAEKLSRERHKLESDEKALAERRNLVRTAREESRKLSTELSRLYEERSQHLSRGQNALALADATVAELEKLNERSEQLKRDKTEARKSIDVSSGEHEKYEALIRESESGLESLKASIESLSAERQAKIEQESRLSGSITSLREKIEDKPRRLLRERLADKAMGSLEEFISYPERLEAALEAVLYDVLGFLASSDIPDIDTLEMEGQAGIVLDTSRSAQPPDRPKDSRIRLWLSDEVTIKSQAPKLLRNRLSEWVLADRKDIVSLMKEHPALSFVTEEGVALRSDGVALLGRPRGVLADRRVLKEMEAEAKSASSQIAVLGNKLENLRIEKESAEKAIGALRSSYLENASALKAAQSELERLEKQESEIARERDRLRKEESARRQEAGAAEEKIREADALIARMEADRDSKEAELSSLEQTLSTEEETLREKLSGLNELLLALGREEEAEHSIEANLSRLDAERKRLEAMVSGRTAEEERIRKEIDSLSISIESLKLEEAGLEESRKEQEKLLEGVDTGRVLEEKKTFESNLASNDAELETLRSNLVQLRTDVLLLGRQMKEMESILEPLSQSAESLPDSTDHSPDEVEKSIQAVQARIADLGPVNEYAAIQYEEEKQELDRIREQHSDVSKAAESLDGIINEINTQARSRYEQTFVSVREEFRRTFTFFFPGGEADLKLENPSDPFNSPIQITARPEGKQLKRLAQLSDGERTMLGISLLFAFYAVRPAPFIFVDELDAPLDDNNVLKFASFLARVRDRIQVFVITHNKRTMEKADTIYGVTMEEPGVSKIISVKLKDVKRQHVAVAEA